MNKRCNHCGISNLTVKEITPEKVQDIFNRLMDDKYIKDFIEFLKENYDNDIVANLGYIISKLSTIIFDIYQKTKNIVIDIEYDKKIKNLSIYVRLIIIDDKDFSMLSDIAYEKSEEMQEYMMTFKELLNYIVIDFDAMTQKEHTKVITTYDTIG